MPKIPPMRLNLRGSTVFLKLLLKYEHYPRENLTISDVSIALICLYCKFFAMRLKLPDFPYEAELLDK